MVMAGFRTSDELAHRKSIQQMAIKNAVLQGDTCGRLADGRIARRLREGESCAINTQTVLHGELDKDFRIDRAYKMVVKIAALGHLLQKSVKKQRLVADRLKISGGLLLC